MRTSTRNIMLIGLFVVISVFTFAQEVWQVSPSSSDKTLYPVSSRH